MASGISGMLLHMAHTWPIGTSCMGWLLHTSQGFKSEGCLSPMKNTVLCYRQYFASCNWRQSILEKTFGEKTSGSKEYSKVTIILEPDNMLPMLTHSNGISTICMSEDARPLLKAEKHPAVIATSRNQLIYSASAQHCTAQVNNHYLNQSSSKQSPTLNQSSPSD